MTILEETDSEYRSELKLWENDHGGIWIQIGYDDDDPVTTQGIALTVSDARALIKELTRLITQIEPEAKVRTLPAETPKSNTGQLFSKVDWGK